MAEYGLITAVIAVAIIIVAVTVFRGAIIGSFSNASSCINNAGTLAANATSC